jgi:glutathione S-transferase
MTTLTLTIGNKNYSSWSLRPWLAMKVAKVPFQEVVIPLGQPDTKKRIADISPNGKVPVLNHDGLIIHDSLAICEYIAETFPHTELWPDERVDRAVARSLCAEMHSGFPALRTALVMNVRRRFHPFYVRAEVLADIDRILRIWTQQREAYAMKGPFLFGPFSITDAFFAPVVTRFETYGVSVNHASRAYMDEILNLPAIREWIKAAEEEPFDNASFEYSSVST